MQSYCAVHNIDEEKNVGDITKINKSELDDFNFICGGSPCFAAGTLITTDNGLKHIEDIEVGDMVLTHTNNFKRVLKTGNHMTDQIYELIVLGCIAKPVTYVTGNHPYYVVNKDDKYGEGRWVPVKDLTKEDLLVTNPSTKMRSRKFQPFKSKLLIENYNDLVYNLEVEDDNSYVANNCIVHNCQDFSLAGQGKGVIWTCEDCKHEYNPLTVHYTHRGECPICSSKNIEKTRSSLLIEWLDVIRTKQPNFGIYENVKNLAHKFKETFKMFEDELNEYGYNTYWKILNAKNFGIPQNRERIYLILIKKRIR